MFANIMERAPLRVRGGENGLLDVLGGVFNRGETLSFSDQSGAFEADEETLRAAKEEKVQLSAPHAVARQGHEIYTRRARTGYVKTATLGRRLDTRG